MQLPKGEVYHIRIELHVTDREDLWRINLIVDGREYHMKSVGSLDKALDCAALTELMLKEKNIRGLVTE